MKSCFGDIKGYESQNQRKHWDLLLYMLLAVIKCKFHRILLLRCPCRFMSVNTLQNDISVSDIRQKVTYVSLFHFVFCFYSN